MGNTEISILLIAAIAGLAWVAVRALRGAGTSGESSARADTFADGAGVAAEQHDNIRNLDR
jgi:hypothetical protein